MRIAVFGAGKRKISGLSKMRIGCVAFLALAVCLPLSGCDRGKAPTGQVAAKVGGQEVTVQEIQAELGGFNAPDAATRKRAEQQALQSIVARKLLAKAATDAGVAKSPDFALQKQRMEDALLVQAWQNNLVKAVPQPAPEEVQQFITQHPEFYANHKVFTVDQLRLPAITDRKIIDELKPLNDLDAIGQVLTGHGIRYTSSKATIDSLSVDAGVLDQIAKMPPGEVFIIPNQNMMIANKIVDTKLVPLSSDVATKHAIQYIKAQRAQETVRRQFGSVVSNSKTKVVYNKAYAPPSPAAKGKPTQGGSNAPAGKAG
jgi:peptidyl-prolyl cis-trans isomerase C